MATPENHREINQSHLPPPIPSQRKRLHDGDSKDSKPISQSDPIQKRVTRDLPNLSDCHCCRTRINYSNPKDRLQTLDSNWRIVLLCRKCIRLVNSAKACSYCLKENLGLDCVSCSRCKRGIHKDCVLRFESSSPWCYSRKERGLLGEFSVCIDCWVPKVLKQSKVCRSGDKPVSKSNVSKVSFNDENVEAKKKSLVSMKENEKEMTKNAFELSAVNEMNGNIDGKLIVGNTVSSSSSSSSTNGGVAKNLNCGELAFPLNNGVNGSEIPKDLQLANAKTFPVPKAREWLSVVSKSVNLGKTPQGGESEKTTLVYKRARVREKFSKSVNLGKTQCGESEKTALVYKRARVREIFSSSISEASFCIRDKKDGSSTNLSLTDAELINTPGSSLYDKDKANPYVDLSGIGHKVVAYKRTRFKRKELQLSDKDDSRVVSESKTCQQDVVTQESHLCEVSIPSPVKCNEDVTLQTEKDHYMLKYSRKCKGSKPFIDLQTNSVHDSETHELLVDEVMTPSLVKSDDKVTLENKSSNEKDRFAFKYSKRRVGPKPEIQQGAASCQATMPCMVKCEGKVNLQNENPNMEERRYLIKYSKRHTGSEVETGVKS